ncbi:hypothetical protein BC826DRAFT_1028682 [Russula brevipes]
MTMETSHLSAEVLSDWNRLGDAPTYRTRAVGETGRAGHQRRRHREAQDKGREQGQTSCTTYMPRHLGAPFNDPPRPHVAQDPARAGGPCPL